jgi:hypothetical protein
VTARSAIRCAWRFHPQEASGSLGGCRIPTTPLRPADCRPANCRRRRCPAHCHGHGPSRTLLSKARSAGARAKCRWAPLHPANRRHCSAPPGCGLAASVNGRRRRGARLSRPMQNGRSVTSSAGAPANACSDCKVSATRRAITSSHPLRHLCARGFIREDLHPECCPIPHVPA